MQIIRVKNFEEIAKFDYAVCEIIECEEEAFRLAMTETKMVDFCKHHYNKHILEIE